MKLERLIDECIEALQEEANNEWYPDFDHNDTIGATVNTDDGYVDLHYYYDKKAHTWMCEALVEHDKDNGMACTNLEQYLSEELEDCVDWNVAEEEYRDYAMDEWQAHGFRDAADFWHWKEGR